MEELIKKVNDLEKRLALLENRKQNSTYGQFKETISSIVISEDNLNSIFNTSMMDEIIKIILDKNKETPFLQYKKHVYKYDTEMIEMTDDDYKYMFEYVQYVIIKQFTEYCVKLKSDDYFEKNNIILGLNLTKNFKKIKSLFLKSL
jgi:hypothetical protein